MDKKTANTVAAILGTLGLLLILAGPAFHFIPTNIGIFAALSSWIIAGLIRRLGGKEEKEEKKEEGKKEEKEEKE